MKTKSLLKALLTSVALCVVAGSASANATEYFKATMKVESGAKYNIGKNQQLESNSAFGAYQIILGNWINLGYVKKDAGWNKNQPWSNVSMTEKSKELGVFTVADIGNPESGWALQDKVAFELAVDMWRGLSSTAKSKVGSTLPNGVFVSEASLLSATWFLGPEAMNQWAATGFTKEGMGKVLNANPQILRSNPTYNVGSLTEHLWGRMKTGSTIDISDITNNVNTMGSSTYTATMEREEEIVCEEEVQMEIIQAQQDHVEKVVQLAQDQDLGYSQMEEPFGKMSCMENIFSGGGLDVLFQAPNIADLQAIATKAFCSKVGGMVREANSNLSNTFNIMNKSVGGSNDIMGSYGVSTTFNEGGEGVNVSEVGGSKETSTEKTIAPITFTPMSGSSKLSTLFTK